MSNKSNSRNQTMVAIPNVPNASSVPSVRIILSAFLLVVPSLVCANPWSIVPQINLSETYTDNVEQQSSALAKDSLISNLGVGFRVERKGPRANLLVDYNLQQLFHTNLSRLNTTQQFLNSQLNTEIIENWFFLDARANITQENGSAFAPITTSDVFSTNQNRAETRTYQISPSIRGRFSDLAVYQLRFNETQSESESRALPTTRSSEWLGKIRNASLAAKIGWSGDLNSVFVNNRLIGNKEDTRASAAIIFALTPQLHITASGGGERTNFATTNIKTKATYGFGLEYSPSSRTQFVAAQESRFFGNSHNVSLSHRTPRTAWRISSVRDVAVLPSQLAAGGSGTIATLMNDLLAASIPDLAARSEAVRRRFESTSTISNFAPVGDFITERPYVNRGTEASAALIGARNTITATVSRADRRSFGVDPLGVSSFAVSDNIVRNRQNFSWAYRVTPVSTLTFLATRIKTTGNSAQNPESDQRAQSLLLTTNLGQRTFASFGVRNTKFDSTAVTGYTEKAIVGTLALRF